MFQFKLPDLGEGVHEGEILHWYVEPGSTVKEDEPLVEVETDKAAVTIPSPRTGKVVGTHGAVGEKVAVGAVLVEIQEDGTSAGAEPSASVASPAAEKKTAPAAASPAPAAAPVPVAAAPAAPSASKRAEPVAAAPATRRLARELGVDLHQVPATGAGGRVTADDVRRYASSGGVAGAAVVAAGTAATVPASQTTAAAVVAGGSTIPFFELEPLPDFTQWGDVELEPLRSIRRKVATKMVASMTIVPHVTHMDEADVTELDAFRRSHNQQAGAEEKITLMAFVMKAVIAQLRRMRQFNASIDPFQQAIVYKRYINLGFAADTPRGLLVPVIHNADRLSVLELAQTVKDLAEKARAGTLDVSKLRGGSFTITNVGSFGGTAVIPTINYPEVAILGLGRAADRPVVRDGQIVVRKIMPIALVFDHRMIDGADAARFVSAVCGMLSDPSQLLLHG